MSDVLLVGDRVDDERERRHRQHGGSGNTDHAPRVQPQLEVVVALENLDGHRGEHGEHPDNAHRTEVRHELAGHGDRGRHRQRVGRARHTQLALAPHEFTGVNRRQNDDEQERGANDGREHLTGDRPQRRAVLEVREPLGE